MDFVRITVFFMAILLCALFSSAVPAFDGVPGLDCLEADCSDGLEGPICVVDATGVARTFYNWCQMVVTSCVQSTHYALVGLGEC